MMKGEMGEMGWWRLFFPAGMEVGRVRMELPDGKVIWYEPTDEGFKGCEMPETEQLEEWYWQAQGYEGAPRVKQQGDD